MNNEQLADEILNQITEAHLRFSEHQLQGRSIEDYDGPTDQQIIISVLDKQRDH